MRLLLVRHGETVDNVAAIYAGVRDSALTTHGVLQATRLAAHLASTGVKISHIYSSDLQRAFKTAEAIQLAQSPSPASTTKLELLREQDFGYYEGKSYMERTNHVSGKTAHRAAHAHEEGFQDVESKESMAARMEQFISSYLVEHFIKCDGGETIVVVAHGIILAYLWRCILKKFDDVSVQSGIVVDRGLERLGGWSNTGYLDLEIERKPILSTSSSTTNGNDRDSSATIPFTKGVSIPTTESVLFAITSPRITYANSTPQFCEPIVVKPPQLLALASASLKVKAVNSLEHIRGLKKTRGGIGSSKHDDKQKTVDQFFKKQRID